MPNRVHDVTVKHDGRNRRFVLDREGTKSVLEYQFRDGTLHFTRTWVADAFRGQGYGDRLVEAGLRFAREGGYPVTTSCWFVARFLDRHPEYQDLRAG
jgi:predicted GNAT family acetyltransferase